MEIDFGIDDSPTYSSGNSYTAARGQPVDKEKDKKAPKKKGANHASSDHQSFDNVQSIASISTFS